MEAKAALRDFLRHRCGNLKAAFMALDSSETGQLNRSDFEFGLRRLGCGEDMGNVFSELDRQNSGLLSLRRFVDGLSEPLASLESMEPRNVRHTYHPGMGTPRSNELAPTLLQRLTPHPVTLPCTPQKALAYQGSPTSTPYPVPVALEDRVRQLEEQLAAEQEARREIMWRLSHFEQLQEEVQALRRLAEDRAQASSYSRMGPFLENLRREDDPEERRYVMVASVSERRLEGAASASAASAESSVKGSARRSEKDIPKLQLTPRTLLRQENLTLREQIMTLREEAIAAKEKEAPLTRSGSDHQHLKDMSKGRTYAPRSSLGAKPVTGPVRMTRYKP